MSEVPRLISEKCRVEGRLGKRYREKTWEMVQLSGFMTRCKWCVVHGEPTVRTQ